MTKDDYFHELCNMVLARDTDVSYEKLMRELFDREFRWVHPMDANRASDGLAIRSIYLDHYDAPCNWLEMLIGLSRRMEFVQGGDETYWFWEIIQNMELDTVKDQEIFRTSIDFIRNTLAIVENRTYSKDGYGGLFPLRHPREDQRDVEIWYQMQAWLMENYDVV